MCIGSCLSKNDASPSVPNAPDTEVEIDEFEGDNDGGVLELRDDPDSIEGARELERLRRVSDAFSSRWSASTAASGLRSGRRRSVRASPGSLGAAGARPPRSVPGRGTDVALTDKLAPGRAGDAGDFGVCSPRLF